jgi:membrane protein
VASIDRPPERREARALRPRRAFFSIARRSLNAWLAHDIGSMGAALSFYTLFSIAPVLLIATWMAGFLLGKDAVRAQILAQLQGLMGEAGATAVGALLTGAAQLGNGVIPTIVGVASLLITATTVFGELQRDLDLIWSTPAAAIKGGPWRMLRTRILSFGMILGLGFLLLVSLFVSATLATFAAWLATLLGTWSSLVVVVDMALGLGVATILFAMIYKFLPNQTITWGDVWIGAFVTAVLFTIGKTLIGVYLSKSAFTSAYGAVGSLLVLLLWIYYSAQIFLLGAAYTREYAYAHGSHAAVTR